MMIDEVERLATKAVGARVAQKLDAVGLCIASTEDMRSWGKKADAAEALERENESLRRQLAATERKLEDARVLVRFMRGTTDHALRKLLKRLKTPKPTDERRPVVRGYDGETPPRR